MKPNEKGTPTGLSPSADTPAQKNRKVLGGRGLALFIGGIAVAAFALYLFIVVYGVASSE